MLMNYMNLLKNKTIFSTKSRADPGINLLKENQNRRGSKTIYEKNQYKKGFKVIHEKMGQEPDPANSWVRLWLYASSLLEASTQSPI